MAMRTCKHCGEKAIPSSARTDAKFCSGRCRVAASRSGRKSEVGAPWVMVADVVVSLPANPVPVEGCCVVCLTPLVGQRRRTCSQACYYRDSYISRRGRRAGAERERYSVADIVARDGLDCALCDDPIDILLAYPARDSASVDHKIPLSRGGTDTLVNVQLAHLACNWQKGASSVN